METMELGAVLVGASLFVFLGTVFPLLLLLTAGVGLVLVVLGYLGGEDDVPTESPDLIECTNCHSLESPDRTTCRFCEEPLTGAGPG